MTGDELAPAVEALHGVVSAMPGGGESRSGQDEMCEAVASALHRDRHLVVAAGTGTGKSMAYLAPLVSSGKKAVVATATKALQDQLVDKDLPLLARALGVPLKYAVLKGRSNYVCRKKLADLAAAAAGGQQQLIAADSALEADNVSARSSHGWPPGPGETADGDRAGLDFEPSVRAWEMVSVSGRECPGAANCPSGSECFAEQAGGQGCRGRCAGGEPPPLLPACVHRRGDPPAPRCGGVRRGSHSRGHRSRRRRGVDHRRPVQVRGPGGAGCGCGLGDGRPGGGGRPHPADRSRPPPRHAPVSRCPTTWSRRPPCAGDV